MIYKYSIRLDIISDISDDMYINTIGSILLYLIYFTNSSFGFITTNVLKPQTTSKLDMSSSEEIMFQSTYVLAQAACQKAMDSACKEAENNGWAVTIAIADAGGVPILVKRLDGAFAASYQIATEKARTAAQFKKETGVLEDSTNVSDGSSRTALLSAPYVLMRGGVPIFINDQIVGSVGVSGVKPNEDEQVAMAAVKALSSAISKL